MVNERPIGIFDSGVGGLTVVRAIQELLPQEHLIYFGDTARFPYGPRDIDEVREFAFEIMDSMQDEGVKMFVVACNSMTAAAFTEAKSRYDLPIVGVIEPAVRATVTSTRNGKVGVIGTKATIGSGEYERAFKLADERIEVHTQVCPGLVEKVEAGDTFSSDLVAMTREYLGPLRDANVDTLVLGCTHYPLLRGVLHLVTKGEVVLVSSAEEVAKDVYSSLVETELLRQVPKLGESRFAVSGDPEEFLRIGSLFLTGIKEVESRPWPSK